MTGITRIQSKRILLSGLWCPECGGRVETERVPRSAELHDGFMSMRIAWLCPSCDKTGDGWIRAEYEEVRIMGEEDFTGMRKEACE